MTIELRITAETAADLAAQVADIQSQLGAVASITPPAASAPTVTTEKVEQAPAVAESSPEPNTQRRRRRTKAEMAADAAKEEAKAEAESTGLSYDNDVRPDFVRLANMQPDGRARAVAILEKYGVKNGKDIPADKLAETLKLIKAEIDALSQPDEDTADAGDDEFEV